MVRVGVQPVSDEDAAALEADAGARRAALNRLLFPAPTRAFEETRERYGDLSVLETADYLYGLTPGTEHVVEIERGVQLYVGLEAIGAPDAKGVRTVMTTLNGQLSSRLRARPQHPRRVARRREGGYRATGQVAAPFSGVVTLKVAVGDRVAAGQPIASIEAMKMEAASRPPWTASSSGS